MSKDLKNGVDYYIEGERVIFTALAHIKRGQCCGNGCRHCPFTPKHTKGKVVLSEKILKFTHNNFNNGAE
jgi:2-iminoacetate synthase ThiH